MHVVEDIDGVVMARAVITRHSIVLALVAPSGFTSETEHAQGTFYPAESITIQTREGLESLHRLLGLMIEAHDEVREPT